MAILRILEIGWLSLMPIAEAAAPYCPIPGFPCPSGGSYFTDYLGRIAAGIGASAAGIIGGLLIFYSLKLAISSTEESNVTEVRTAYLHVIFGAILIAGAAAIASIVPATSIIAVPGSTTTGGTFLEVLEKMINFFFGMMAAAIIINIGYHGARLITAQDDSGGTNARQGMLRGAIGLTMVMVAGTVLGGFDTSSVTNINLELIGAGDFIITLLGALAVVAMVIASIMLVLSVDEQLKDRAKKIIISAGVSLIVVMASAIIITTFI